MEIKELIGLATAIGTGVGTGVYMFMKKFNRGNSKYLPCKTHEEQIKAHKEQIDALFTKDEENDKQFNALMIAYTKEMTTIGTTLNLFILSNEKEHKDIVELIKSQNGK